MKTVLVVEDNPDNELIIHYALQRAGYHVISASTGEKGVDLAISEQPFFIVMDIGLPSIDGIEATRRIRAAEKGNSVPIVAITSYAMLGDRDKILKAGCNGYFEKPFDPITIVERIHAILGL